MKFVCVVAVYTVCNKYVLLIDVQILYRGYVESIYLFNNICTSIKSPYLSQTVYTATTQPDFMRIIKTK